MSNDDSRDVKQEAGQPSVSNRLLAGGSAWDDPKAAKSEIERLGRRVAELETVCRMAIAWRNAEKRHALIHIGELKGSEGNAERAMEVQLRELRLATDKLEPANAPDHRPARTKL